MQEQTLLPLNKFRIPRSKIILKDNSELVGGGIGKVQLGTLQKQFPVAPTAIAVKQINLAEDNLQDSRVALVSLSVIGGT